MKKLISILSVLFACSALAFGQASFTTTTLSNAITADTTANVNVASATSVLGPGLPASNGSPAALTLLLVDREVMRVNSVNGTAVSVSRGFYGTISAAHASAAKVWVGPASYFISSDPASGSPCVATQLVVLPRVNYANGNAWNCGNSKWTLFSPTIAQMTEGATIASATTVAPTNPIHAVSGTTAIVTITTPAACPAVCTVTFVPTGAWTYTTAGNLGLAGTATVAKPVVFTLLPSTGKWYPSY